MNSNEFFKLYQEGNSLSEIALLHGVSRQRVSQVLQKHPDYKPRSRSNALKLMYDKIEASRHTLKSLPLSSCTICSGKVSTTHKGEKRDVCSKCWLKHTIEGRKYNAKRHRKDYKESSNLWR